jgi:hypothetical protein
LRVQLVRWKSTRKKSLAQGGYHEAFMLIRDNKFDEFMLLDKIHKINMTHALARLSASVSRRINAHLSTNRERSHMYVHRKPRNAYLTNFLCARSIYQCVRHKKAATQNWRIQICIVETFVIILILIWPFKWTSNLKTHQNHSLSPN